MKKLLMLVLLLLPILAQGQATSHTAYRIRYGAALPATCNPATGDVFFKTAATIGTYQCLVLNTWTAMGGSAFASGGATANVVPKSNGSGQLQDSPLLAPDANTVRQANLANGQVFEVYGTTDSNATPVNYQRLEATFSGGVFTLQTAKGGSGANADLFFGNSSGGRIVFRSNGNNLTLNTNGTIDFTNSAGLISKYKNVATAGYGVETIYAANRVTAQAAANAGVATYTNIASDGTFVVSANVLVTTATSHSFTVTCAYTDEGNTARTLTLPFLLVAGSTITNTIVNTNGAVPYMGIPVQIRVKASTTITIATTGTFTTVAYNAEGIIRQVN